MFIDFINKVIYGDKDKYLARFSVDTSGCNFDSNLAFRLYIEPNYYMYVMGYDITNIHEEYPIIEEIIEYVINYYNTTENSNLGLHLKENPQPLKYYYENARGCWAVDFYKKGD